MTVDDRTRLNLHRKLEAVLGPDDADALMAHLPPVTRHDVATKADLDALVMNLRHEVRAEISQAMERQIRGMVTFNTALVAAALAAARTAATRIGGRFRQRVCRGQARHTARRKRSTTRDVDGV